MGFKALVLSQEIKERKDNERKLASLQSLNQSGYVPYDWPSFACFFSLIIVFSRSSILSSLPQRKSRTMIKEKKQAKANLRDQYLIKERELLGDCLDRSLTLPIDLTRQSSPNPKLSLSNIETDFPNFLVIYILLRRFSTIPQERSLLLSLSLKE